MGTNGYSLLLDWNRVKTGINGYPHITPEILKLIAEIDEFKGRWKVMESLAPAKEVQSTFVTRFEDVPSLMGIEPCPGWMLAHIDPLPVAGNRHLANHPRRFQLKRQIGARQQAMVDRLHVNGHHLRLPGILAGLDNVVGGHGDRIAFEKAGGARIHHHHRGPELP